ncbi:SERPINB12 [Cordylochernes scorpioides]|uniref:SERPINB12 n=1 Tax=Cordylochernes scorpioides TaxID=51811 RepID=A0ABY6JX33_9ARAC|nr:SERPINB12 [Cordylochernes scorpioides]
MIKSKLKCLLITFFDVKGLVHYDFVPEGQTINQHYYLDVLRRLREAMKLPLFWAVTCTAIAFTYGAPSSSRILRLANTSNAFGFEVCRRLEKSGNLVICPYSISIAMGMVYLGSGGNTAAELQQVLRYAESGLLGESVHAAFSETAAQLGQRHAGEESTFRSANAVMVQNGHGGLMPFYREKLLSQYGASVDEVDFSEDGLEILTQLNAWVRARTDINTFLKEPFEADTRVALLNAVRFKGKWQTRFDDRVTVPDTFYAHGRVPKTVPMMQMKQRLPYDISVRLDSYVLVLPYASNMSMVIFLPRERSGLEVLERIMTPTLFYNALSDLKEILVQIALPRFKMEADQELMPLLQNMGLRDVFDPTRANLTMLAKRAKGLSVSRVVSKTIIEVNEEGTKASGVTGVSAGVRIGGPLHDLFRADHPFLFFIKDDATNLVLFMGRVVDP